MTLYETMFVRRSVRRYDPAPLDDDTLNNILLYLSSIPQLPGQQADFRLLTATQVEGGKGAPHYIAASCPANPAAYANVGYVLEQADLYLQSLGLGTLWLGLGSPREPHPGDCILMAFGRTAVPLRTDAAEFNRLALDKISAVDNPVAQAARLAPSAVNSQPWMLEFSDRQVVIHYHGRGLMKSVLGKKFNKIDVGIVTRFVTLALEHEGKTVLSVTPRSGENELSITVSYC